MRISHGDLETVRLNPSNWFQNRTPPHGFKVRPKMQCWQDAIRRYHDVNGSRDTALQYLEEKFSQHYKRDTRNARELAMYSQFLMEYVSSFESLPHITNKLRYRIEQHVQGSIYLVGEIGRLDAVNPVGYAVTLFRKDPSEWRGDLRMPILQAYFANQYGCKYQEVRVGVYTLSASQHEYVRFSSGQIKSALEELSEIGRVLTELGADSPQSR